MGNPFADSATLHANRRVVSQVISQIGVGSVVTINTSSRKVSVNDGWRCEASRCLWFVSCIKLDCNAGPVCKWTAAETL